MKTTKLTAFAIAVIFAAAATMAQSESPSELAPNPDPQTITISLKKALLNHDLVFAMQVQLNPAFLEAEKPLYTVPVKLKNDVFYVVGTYNEWCTFFKIDDDAAYKANDGKMIHLKEAILDVYLVKAMHEQLTPYFLREERPVYTAKVKYKGSIVTIFANYREWKWFFRVDDNPNCQES